MEPMFEHIEEYGGWDLPEGCTWSEKFDGIHACWTGSEFLSKTGKRIHVPDCVARPAEPCSGELWLGRGRFQEMLKVYVNPSDQRWQDVRFVPFHLLVRRPVTDVHEHLRSVTTVGGEGIVIYAPNGEAWKLKERNDAEAEVVCRNRRHSYTVRCRQTGVVFNLTARAEATAGDLVTYSYVSRFKSGRPREPIMKAVRNYE